MYRIFMLGKGRYQYGKSGFLILIISCFFRKFYPLAYTNAHLPTMSFLMLPPISKHKISRLSSFNKRVASVIKESLGTMVYLPHLSYDQYTHSLILVL